jgi:hypothetical protein
LQPLTEVAPDAEELAVFVSTLSAVLKKLAPQKPVVHLVGASRVEDMVDWTALCSDGATLVLTGPQVEPLAKMVKGRAVVPRNRTGQACVIVIRGLYSRGFVREALGGDHPAVEPHIVMLYNADVYMHYWRRTLAELIIIRTPVIITMYCEYEGAELMNLLEAPATAFSADALTNCDEYIRKRYRGDADEFLGWTPVARPLPSVRMLWHFGRNPHAPSSVDCLAKPYRHGTRNSYWVAFTGVLDEIEL